MRFLVSGDQIAGTSGYSKVVSSICKGLIDRKHKVAHIPMGRAQRMAKFGYKGVLMYPSGFDRWNEDVFLDHYIDWNSDIMLTVKDVWLFNKYHRYAVNFVPIVPIDHEKVTRFITARLQTCFKAIAISRFGQRELRHAGIENVEYIPHDVDTDIYKPLEGRKDEIKKMFFTDSDVFNVGFVGLNRVRKMIAHNLRGFKLFLDWNPDVKARMWLWTNITPTRSIYTGYDIVDASDTGVNLQPEIMHLQLGNHVWFPQWDTVARLGGLPEWTPNFLGRQGWDMVKMYNSFDTLLLASGGEGFGLPLLEAQSCGVPVITTDYAAGPEIVGAGLTVRMKDYIILRHPGTRLAIPDEEDIARALSKIYNTDREKLARRARRFALRYSHENVWKTYWEPFLEKCERELYPLATKEGISKW